MWIQTDVDNSFGGMLYLTIIPRARMGSESIAHEAEGRMGNCLRGHEGESWSKISRRKKIWLDKARL